MDPSPAHDMLREFLADRDVPCPGCGYSLARLTADRCPECNQPLQLQVGLVEPRLRAFLAAVIGLACGVGFSGLLLVYMMIAVARGRGASQFGEFLIVTGCPFAIEGGCLVLLLRSRVWFRAISAPGRSLTIVACWLLTAANIVLFSFFD